MKLWWGYTGFVYDCISDDEILSATKYIEMCDISIDWQDDTRLHNSYTVPVELKHAARIAALAMEYKSGKGFSPITFDTYSLRHTMSGITDGNHRIRALQFLKIPWFPVVFSGDTDVLSKVSVNMDVVKLVTI
jgi:hypothetical protein